jgi:hypothetical protein
VCSSDLLVLLVLVLVLALLLAFFLMEAAYGVP